MKTPRELFVLFLFKLLNKILQDKSINLSRNNEFVRTKGINGVLLGCLEDIF